KWGASPAITVIPPEAGEPEALRQDALRKLRDIFVDSLAERIDRSFAVASPERVVLAEADRKSVVRDKLALGATSTGTYAGLSLSGRLVALLGGQMRRVEE